MKLKKLAALAIALMLLLGMMPTQALAATESCRGNDGGPHKWVVGEEEPATCQDEGWRSYYCAYCGAGKDEGLPKTGHSWGGWKVTKAASCTATGTRQRTCKVCGTVQTDTLARTDHAWGSWKVTKEATCTETGTRERTCTVCGEKQTDSVAKAPHTWGEWAVVTEATDHSSGTRAHTCQVCGAQETEDYDPEGTLRRGARGDAVTKLQQALICYGALNAGGADGSYGPGTERAVAQVQEAEGLAADGVAWPQTQARLGHRFGEWETVSELGDFSKGVRQRVCARCGYTETEEEWPEPLFRRGDKGEGVQALQQALNAAGYNCGTPDGDFGRKTENAVSALESANGIPADGIAWPGVLKLLGFGGGAAGVSDLVRMPKNPHALNLTGVQVSAEQSQYYEGDFLTFRLVLTNNSGQKLKSFTLYADGDNNPWTNGGFYGAAGDADLETGSSYPFGDRLEQLTHAAAQKGEYTASWFVGATLEDGTYVRSNAVSFTVAPILGAEARPDTGAAIALEMAQTSEPRAVYMLGEDGNSEAITYVATVANTGIVPVLFKTLRVFRDGDKRVSWLAADLETPVRLEPGETYSLPVSETLAWSYMSDTDAETKEKQGCDGICTLRFEAYGLDPETGALSCSSGMRTFNYYAALARKVPENTPRLALDATVQPETVAAGGALQIVFCATNTGSVPLEEVSFELGVESEGGETLKDLALSAERQTLQPGESTSLSHTYVVPDLAITGTQLLLNLSASGWHGQGDGRQLLNSQRISRTVAVVPAGETAQEGPDLAIWLSTAGGFLLPGDAILVDVMAENTGTEVLKDVYLYYVMTSDDGELIEEGPLTDMVTNTEFLPGEEMFGGVETVMPDYDVSHGAVVLNFVAHGTTLAGEEVISEPDVAYFATGGVGGTGPGDLGIQLTAAPEAIVAGAEETEVEAAYQLTNTSDVALKLSALTSSTNGTIVESPWMGEPLEPGESYPFTLRIALNEGWTPWTYGWALAEAENPNTGETVEAYLRVPVLQADPGPAFAMIVDDTTGMGGQVGEGVPVKVWLANTGDKALGDLHFAYGSGSGKSYAAESISGAPAPEAQLAPGEGFCFYYNVVVSPDDAAAGMVHRQLTAFLRDAETGEQLESAEDVQFAVYSSGETAITVFKDATSVPADGVGFALNEVITYRIHVTNNTDEDIYDVEVYDPLHGSNEDMMVDLLQPLPANATHTVTFDYTVTQEDIERGYILNQANVVWIADEEQCEVKSNEVMLPTVVPEDHGVTIVKSVDGSPAKSEGYQEDETISYSITVVNETGAEIADVQIYDPLHGSNEDAMVDIVPSLAPGESHTVSFDYTVTQEDVERAFVLNQAEVTWVDVNGQQGEALSEAVIVPVIPAEQPPKPTVHAGTDILLEKFQWNLPADESGYALGETIEYRIFVTNMTDASISGVEVHDPLDGLLEGVPGNTCEIAVLPPHEEVRLKFEHVVTEEDVNRGYVDNYAYAFWPGDAPTDTRTTQTEIVRVRTIGGEEKPLAPYALSIFKSEISSPAEANGYQLNELIDFEIAVTNDGTAPIESVTIYDHANSSEAGVWVGEIQNLQPHETQKLYWNYYVTQEDMDRLYMTNYATGVWTDPASGEEEITVSNTAVVNTYVEGDPPVEWHDLTIHKEEFDIPENGSWYVAGEEITFRITVENDTPETFTGVKITDSLYSGEGHVLAEFDRIDPDCAIEEFFTYKVTEADVAAGSVVNYAGVTASDEIGDAHYSESEHVSVPTGGEEALLTVHQAEISSPANAKFYGLGEEIVYRISVVNETEKLISQVNMYDILMPGSGQFDEIVDFQPHESRTYDLKYTVQQADVDACSVWNLAFADYKHDETESTAFSEAIESPTGVKTSTVAPPPVRQEAEGSCVRRLRALGCGQADYALEYCGTHGAIAAQVKALVQQAGTGEAALAAWQQAEQLWTDAVNAEYDALMGAASGGQKVAVLSERLMFFADLSCRRKALALEAPDEPEKVCRRVSELLMNKCADLCYEAHTVPADRADSRYHSGVQEITELPESLAACARLVTETADGAEYREQTCLKHRALDVATAAILQEALTEADKLRALRLTRQWWQTELDRMWAERYQAAQPESRIVIAQEKEAMVNWLQERERLLEQLYPERPVVVAEVMAGHVIERVLDLCGDQPVQ